jgi:hypothetical protein
MESRILGKVPIDPTRLERDLEVLLAAPASSQEYSEYRFGTFLTYILRSPTGSEQDGLFRGVGAAPLRTPLGRSLEYIDALVEDNFNVKRLQMVRAYLLHDALLVPHRDYVEFKRDAQRMARIHLPLRTNPHALHSEDAAVFHMRQGEVWHLDVTRVHSACNASSEARVSLVLDFFLDGEPPESILREPCSGAGLTPQLIERPPLARDFESQLRALSALLSQDTFRDIVQLLSRIHFHRQAHARDAFRWLQAMCEVSGDARLLEKARGLLIFLAEERELGERFVL